MSTYLIDYENTTTNGIKGIENLAASDQVILFYGNNPAALPFPIHIQLANAKAAVSYLKAEKIGKNYLDFQLTTYCGYLIGTTKETHYVIISKDTGYDSIIDFWKKKKPHLHISRFPSIEEARHPHPVSAPAPKLASDALSQAEMAATLSAAKQSSSLPSPNAASQKVMSMDKLSEAYKKKIRAKMKTENLKGGSYNSIYNLFLKADSKQNLNIGLVKAFQQERGNRLYKLLLPDFECFLAAK